MGASLVNKEVTLLARKGFTNVDTHISLLICFDLFLVGCIVTLALRTPCPVIHFSSQYHIMIFLVL